MIKCRLLVKTRAKVPKSLEKIISNTLGTVYIYRKNIQGLIKKIMHETILNCFGTLKIEALRTNHQQTICWQHECLQILPSKCSTVVSIIHRANEFTYPTTIYRVKSYDVVIWFESRHFNQTLGVPFWVIDQTSQIWQSCWILKPGSQFETRPVEA